METGERIGPDNAGRYLAWKADLILTLQCHGLSAFVLDTDSHVSWQGSQWKLWETTYSKYTSDTLLTEEQLRKVNVWAADNARAKKIILDSMRPAVRKVWAVRSIHLAKSLLDAFELQMYDAGKALYRKLYSKYLNCTVEKHRYDVERWYAEFSSTYTELAELENLSRFDPRTAKDGRQGESFFTSRLHGDRFYAEIINVPELAKFTRDSMYAHIMARDEVDVERIWRAAREVLADVRAVHRPLPVQPSRGNGRGRS